VTTFSVRSSFGRRLLSVPFTFLLAFGFSQSSEAQVLINEVDADQVSTDSAEFVELYDGGTGNTDLSGLALVFYNGSDDLSYLSFDLDGQTTNGDGYFVLCGDAANTANCDLDVSPNTNLIQNGEDAVALLVGDAVNYPNDTALPADGDIVDAIVYETGSDANSGLLVLLNAGQSVINEGGGGNSTADSNQRCANGAGGARNTNTYVQAAPSPGADNTCAAEPPGPSIPDVIINEVDADQVSTDSAEFVELYDGGSGNTDLSGLSIVFYNGSDDQSYIAFDLDGQSTGGDGYFVLCASAANTANCDLDVSPDTNLIQNGADAVALLVGDAVNYPNDTALPADGDIVDAIVYDTNDSDDAGILVLLNAGQPQVNEGGNGDQTGHSNQRCANGAGGARNTGTYTQAVPSPGAANTCESPPVATNVIINEVDADQASTDSAEFVELYDGGSGNTDLSGLSIVLFNGSDDASYLAFDLDGQSTDSNGYFSPNTNLIQNGADAVALIAGDAVNFPNDTPVTTTNLIDAIVYDTNDGDDVGLLVLLNAGQPQVNEGGGGNQTGHSNQRCENGAGGARNTDSYEQFAPTPGAENICVLPVVGPFEVWQIQSSGPESPFASQNVRVWTQDNIVTALSPDGFFMQTPGDMGRDDMDPDTSNGIFVFTGGSPMYDAVQSVAVGDMIDVTGSVVEFFGFTEYTNSPELVFKNAGITLPLAVAFDASTPSPDPMSPSCALEFECYEGMLITIADGTVTGPNQRFGTDPIAEVHITAAPARTFREPGIEFPGMPPIPTWDGNPEVGRQP